MQFIYPSQEIVIAGVATEATLLQVQTNTANTVSQLQSSNTFLSDIYDRVATETTLASVDSKVLTDAQLRAAPVPVSAASLPLPTGAATQATLASIDGKVLTDTQLRASPVPVSAASLPLPSGAATEATLANVQTAVDALNARTAGSLSPVEYDEQVISYVLAGNGIGEIFQIVYKSATVTVATVTLSYDSSNRVNGVVRS